MLRLHTLLAAALLALAMVSPAPAADDPPADYSAGAHGVSRPIPGGAVSPDSSSYKGLAETLVTAGLQTTGVPCADCALGAEDPNIGLPWPVFSVSQGQTMTISTWWEATTYSGDCTADLTLKQGKKVIGTATYSYPGGCAAGNSYGAIFTVAVPKDKGLTTVIGSVEGGENQSSATTHINVQ